MVTFLTIACQYFFPANKVFANSSHLIMMSFPLLTTALKLR